MANTLGNMLTNTEYEIYFADNVQEPRNANGQPIIALVSNAGTRCSWDFSRSLGDTMKEKYQSFYVKLVEVTNILVRKGGKGKFSLLASPSITAMFESGEDGLLFSQDQRSWGKEITEIGVVNNRWRLYQVTTLNDSECVICDESLTAEYSAVVTVSNFVI